MCGVPISWKRPSLAGWYLTSSVVLVCAGAEAALALFLFRMKNIANKATRITTASPTPTPIPAAAPADSPELDVFEGDDPVEEGAESLVAVAVPESIVVVGGTAIAVRLVVGYVYVIISQQIHLDVRFQESLTFTVEYRLSPIVLKLVNVKCSPGCAEVIFESIAIKALLSTFSRQSDPLARLEK